jgi:serine/threonine protein kinase
LQQRFNKANLSAADALCQLCACDGDFHRAVERVEETLNWRQSFFTFSSIPDHQSLGDGCVFYRHGTDAQGHPLLVFNSRYLRPMACAGAGADELRQSRDNPMFLRWMVFVVDTVISELPPDVLQVTLLVNRAGGRKHIDWELARFFFNTLNNHFPNRLHSVVFYPANLALKAAVGIFKSVMGPAVEGCKVICSLEALRELIPDEHIPILMGGSCTYKVDTADYPTPTVWSSADPVVLQSTSHSSATTVITDHDHDQISPPVSQQRTEDARGGSAGRARSIVGSYSYMAPEMIIMMVPVRGYTHSGYTKAVDWWSLGVTIYRLLSGKYPFKTDIPKPVTPEDIITEGSDRYSLLLEKIDYSWFSSHSAVPEFISQLLVVDDKERLGYGPDGSTDVSAHPFFRGINWVELEQKKARPPPLPKLCAPRPESQYEFTLDGILRGFGKEDWLGGSSSGGHSAGQAHFQASLEQQERLDRLNAQLEYWEYASPAVVLKELQISGRA